MITNLAILAQVLTWPQPSMVIIAPLFKMEGREEICLLSAAFDITFSLVAIEFKEPPAC